VTPRTENDKADAGRIAPSKQSQINSLALALAARGQVERYALIGGQGIISCTAVTLHEHVGDAIVGRDETAAFFGVDNRLRSRASRAFPKFESYVARDSSGHRWPQLKPATDRFHGIARLVCVSLRHGSGHAEG
jgi:hypothetical protein